MSKKETFVLYNDWSEFFPADDDKFCADLIRAIFKYQKEGIVPNEPNIKTVFNFLKTQLDKNNEKYAKVSNERSKAAKQKWNKYYSNESKNMQMHTNASNESKSIQVNAIKGDNDNDNENDNGNDIHSHKGNVYHSHKENDCNFCASASSSAPLGGGRSGRACRIPENDMRDIIRLYYGKENEKLYNDFVREYERSGGDWSDSVKYTEQLKATCAGRKEAERRGKQF